MDVNYPDQIVSLFAVRHRDRRRHGGAPHAARARSSTSRSARSRPSRWARRSWPPRPIRRGRQAPRGNTEEGVVQQDAYRCQRRALDRRHAAMPPIRRSTRSARRGTATDAVAALLARGIAAAPCNDGADLLRDTSARRCHPGARRTRRAGEGPALPARRQGHHHRARRARSRPAHRRGVARASGLRRCRAARS